MKQYKGFRLFRLINAVCSIALLCLVSTPPSKAATGSYSITVQDGVASPLGWCFANKTVANAFPTVADGTRLDIWDSVNNTWLTTISWSDFFGEWSDPNFVLTNGVGFLYTQYTGSSITVTCSGTLITATNVSLPLVGGHWNLVCDPYLRTNFTGGFLECVYNSQGNAQYTDHNLNYLGATGDVAATWNETINDFVSGTRVSGSGCGWTPFWQQTVNPSDPCDQAWGSWVSPQAFPGRAIWVEPTSNKTWNVPLTAPSCN
jgi:hypothetical protein